MANFIVDKYNIGVYFEPVDPGLGTQINTACSSIFHTLTCTWHEQEDKLVYYSASNPLHIGGIETNVKFDDLCSEIYHFLNTNYLPDAHPICDEAEQITIESHEKSNDIPVVVIGSPHKWPPLSDPIVRKLIPLAKVL